MKQISRWSLAGLLLLAAHAQAGGFARQHAAEALVLPAPFYLAADRESDAARERDSREEVQTREFRRDRRDVREEPRRGQPDAREAESEDDRFGVGYERRRELDDRRRRSR